MVINDYETGPKIRKKKEHAGDVIDLGAPRRLRTAHSLKPPFFLTPNPRLYPSSKKDSKSRPIEDRSRRRNRKLVPNSRLYRPPPARPPPAPPRPRAAWPAPAPRTLDTASRAALRVLRARRLRPEPAERAAGDAAHSRRRGPGARPPLGSASSARADASVMAASKYSTSPDCSDGNEASSAPSEFLAEFLSAIMRRQYAEALKYCQLILQYEPHNSTARGFYPLLQHKLLARAADDTSSSDDTGSRGGGAHGARFKQRSKTDAEEEAEVEAEAAAEAEAEEMDQGSGSACSSLELDSSASGVARSSASSEPSDSASWRWESGGERSERDDNGNPAPTHSEGAAGDDENDNAQALATARRAFARRSLT
ncbi:cilia- and flagella-associated protein 91 isoform X2 [Vanessa cardui]|uniref:cilia- and flagella-associated protein 91 isoform X2 n=1 Tax=Vanessa cardui TaxID=171605 RepID=UPI001F1326A5|nr:cilia- and flagella-associated protein 91 isoform X2 [Vanessa cardui]